MLLKAVNYDMKSTNTGLKVSVVADIMAQVKAYTEKKGIKDATIITIEDNSEYDTDNQRYDIEIVYVGEGKPEWATTTQKLLYLKGEVIDGLEFHRRANEFYPAEKRVRAMNPEALAESMA